MTRTRLSSPALTPLSPARDTGELEAWALVTTHPGESCRWQASDGRWVAISLATGEDLGKMMVYDCSGRRQFVEDYEFALALARSWRV